MARAIARVAAASIDAHVGVRLVRMRDPFSLPSASRT
jgi:hypothetical protein